MGGDGGGGAPREPARALEPGPTRPPGFRSASRSGALDRGPLRTPSHRGPVVCLYQSWDRRVSDQAPCGERQDSLSGLEERSGFCPATNIQSIPLRPPPATPRNKEERKSLTRTPDSTHQPAGQRGRLTPARDPEWVGGVGPFAGSGFPAPPRSLGSRSRMQGLPPG